MLQGRVAQAHFPHVTISSAAERNTEVREEYRSTRSQAAAAASWVSRLRGTIRLYRSGAKRREEGSVSQLLILAPNSWYCFGKKKGERIPLQINWLQNNRGSSLSPISPPVIIPFLPAMNKNRKASSACCTAPHCFCLYFFAELRFEIHVFALPGGCAAAGKLDKIPFVCDVFWSSHVKVATWDDQNISQTNWAQF